MTRFKHECRGCVPLGGWGKYDLYFCPQGGDPTVIARHGDEPEAYTSGLVLAGVCLPLSEAKRRAVSKGLLTVE